MRLRILTITILKLLMMVSAGRENPHARSIQSSTEDASTLPLLPDTGYQLTFTRDYQQSLCDRWRIRRPQAGALLSNHCLPNARLHIMLGVGHVSFWEASDEFNQILLDFLQS